MSQTSRVNENRRHTKVPRALPFTKMVLIRARRYEPTNRIGKTIITSSRFSFWTGKADYFGEMAGEGTQRDGRDTFHHNASYAVIILGVSTSY